MPVFQILKKFPFYVRKVSVGWKTFERIMKESKSS